MLLLVLGSRPDSPAPRSCWSTRNFKIEFAYCLLTNGNEYAIIVVESSEQLAKRSSEMTSFSEMIRDDIMEQVGAEDWEQVVVGFNGLTFAEIVDALDDVFQISENEELAAMIEAELESV